MKVGKQSLAVALLSGFLLIGATVPLQARDRDDRCEQRVRKAEQQLARAVQRHGEGSRQAQNRRREVDRERSRCNVGNQGNWNNHDHDRDRDHDRDHDHR